MSNSYFTTQVLSKNHDPQNQDQESNYVNNNNYVYNKSMSV